MSTTGHPGGDDGRSLRDWGLLDPKEQTALLIEHGRHLDGLPPTCDLDTKTQRLRDWLRERGIRYPG